ncbi:MAG: dienelactone hydrolase family protein [Acidimicrobiaceae bacterium]|nr:dienelactone hydrolase family protein [Acidimicrobiaceae bacterium]
MNTLGVRESMLVAESDGAALLAPRARPAAGGACPAVVLFQDRMGVRDAMRAFARRLAAHGFDVVIPDLYHRHGALIGFGPHELAADPSSQDRLNSYMAALDDDGIQRDADAVLEALAAARSAENQDSGDPGDPLGRLGCVGFCLGARAVFRTMMRLPERFAAGAMWHPSFLVDDRPDSPHRSAAELAGSLYAGFGEDDNLMTVASMQPFIEALSALGERAAVDLLPGAGHGFTWPGAPNYNRAAAERAWTSTLALFDSALR